MTVGIPRVPASVTGDAGDVVVALEIAGAFCEKGDSDEAIRWLKRASEAAGEAGDATRSASLAHAARELEAASSVTVPPGRDVRVRVSVKTSARDPNLLLVRPLPEGQQPPTGTREAFLVLGTADIDGRIKANGGGIE